MTAHQSRNPASPPSRGAHPPGRRQFMLALMVCGGACAAWHMGVRPLEQRLNDTRAELQALHTTLTTFDAQVASEPPLSGVIEALESRGRRTNRAVIISGDATRLYHTIHELAKANSVKLSRIEPSAARSARTPGDKAVRGAEVYGYSIEVNGTYQSIARFLDAFEQNLGVSKIVQFHISTSIAGQTSKDPILTAIIDTTHLKIAVPDVGHDALPRSADASQEKGS